MAIIRQKREKHFSIVNNEILNDTRLSFKARGLLIYMLSMKDDWKFYSKELAKHSQKDGKDSIQSALKEIEQAGYLQRIQTRQKNGRFGEQDWLLVDTPTFSPQPEKPSTVEPRPAKPQPANPQLTNTNNNNTLPKQVLKESSSSIPPQKSKSKDPFNETANSKEEEDQKISELIEWFLEVTGVSPLNNQYRQINKALHKMSLTDANNLMHQVVDSMGPTVHDPVAYLIKSLMNVG